MNGWLLVALSLSTGVKGWVKVESFTEPRENLFKYGPWWLKTARGWREIEFDQSRVQGKGLVAHIVGLDDRDEARNYCQQGYRHQ